MRSTRIACVLRTGVAVAALALAAGCGSEPERDLPPRASSSSAADPSDSGEPEPHPSDGEGRTRILPDAPVRVSSWGSWTVEWVAGPSGLTAGGAAVLQVSPFWGWSPPQTGQPESPGYTTANCSAPGATLQVEESGIPMSVLARVTGGRLAPGDTLRFVYGDTAAGGPRALARADRYAEAFEELLIKTDGNGDGYFVAPPDQPTLTIVPDPVAYLAVAAPAVVEPGRPFVVAVHGLDPLGNRAELPDGDLRLSVRRLATGGDPLSEAGVEIPVDWTRRAGGAHGTVTVSEPGLYRLEATHAGGVGDAEALAGRGDLLLVEADSPFAGILWGDIHCHSALSDGTGAPDDLYSFARDVAGLDVCVVTDHDAHGLFPLAERGGWDTIRRATRDAYEPGKFVTLLGYEWTNWTYGHRNVYYPGMEGEVFAWLDPASDSPEELWEKIAPFGGMTVAHHPGGGPIAQDWSVPTDSERETVVEICSIHGSSEEMGVEGGIYRPVPTGMVRHAFNQGHELGILASGDTHDGHPGRRTAGAPTNGLAAFRAGERTREAVWDAMRDRNVYGTSGARILLATDWGGQRTGVRRDREPD
ncbi:MAG TPA: DUF3604 domain-containing protein, partial [bacterium]|nr:DUF3604 domain-containing protein [bacterium]